MRAAADPGVLLLGLWIVVPLALFTFSGTQERRYLVPLFPPLAILGAWALEAWIPNVARGIRRLVAPALLIVAAVWLWVAPPRFLNQADRAIAAHRDLLRSRIPVNEPLTYLGPDRGYWPIANPMLYYVKRLLEPSVTTPEEGLLRAATRSSHLLLCDRAQLPALAPLVPGMRTVVEGGTWVVLDVTAGAGVRRP